MSILEKLPEGSFKDRLQGLLVCWLEEHTNPTFREIEAEEQRLLKAFCDKSIHHKTAALRIQAAINKEERGKGPSNTYQSGVVDGLKQALAYIEEGEA